MSRMTRQQRSGEKNMGGEDENPVDFSKKTKNDASSARKLQAKKGTPSSHSSNAMVRNQVEEDTRQEVSTTSSSTRPVEEEQYFWEGVPKPVKSK